MIDDVLGNILQLQKQYTYFRTEPMERRGRLVKRELPDWISSHLPEINPDLLIDDLAVEGQDAIGNYSRVPWVRVFSKKRSPKAPNGWYVVFFCRGW